MNQNKTKPNDANLEDFLAKVSPKMLDDTHELIELMRQVSSEPPVMWGASIIGFGSYHYRYASGREGDWMKIGFSPRKAGFSLYLSCDADMFADELARLGKYTRGKGCIYIKKLDDIDRTVLRDMIVRAYEEAGDYNG